MKYAIILNNEIVYKYESDTKQVFGGPWGSEDAIHLEIPEHLNLNLLSWDGESFGQRELTLEEQQNITNEASKKYLNETDWLVLRHQGQLALGISTSLSQEAYLELESNRQNARDSIVE
jgi:hypothetical protein